MTVPTVARLEASSVKLTAIDDQKRDDIADCAAAAT
jgi:hypothetical protein